MSLLRTFSRGKGKVNDAADGVGGGVGSDGALDASDSEKAAKAAKKEEEALLALRKKREKKKERHDDTGLDKYAYVGTVPSDIVVSRNGYEKQRPLVIASCVAELPPDAQESVQRMKIDLALCDLHFPVLCNVLTFCDKHRPKRLFRDPGYAERQSARQPNIHPPRCLQDEECLFAPLSVSVAKKSLKLEHCVGEGGFGEVYQAKVVDRSVLSSAACERARRERQAAIARRMSAATSSADDDDLSSGSMLSSGTGRPSMSPSSPASSSASASSASSSSSSSSSSASSSSASSTTASSSTSPSSTSTSPHATLGEQQPDQSTTGVSSLLGGSAFAMMSLTSSTPTPNPHDSAGALSSSNSASDLRSGPSEKNKKVKYVALKILHHSTVKQQYLNRLEASWLSSIDHPNICGYFCSHIVAGECWMLMELLRGGSLKQLTRCAQTLGKRFLETEMAYVATRMLRGINYLHKQHVAHRDLKNLNVMITEQAEVKIIDFGLAADLSKGPRVQMTGSPLWMAPEMVRQEPHSFPVDVWSFSICVLELANHYPPNISNEKRAMFRAAVVGLVDDGLESPQLWSSDLKDFLRKCQALDPTQRATCAQLLEHTWLSRQNTTEHMMELFRELFVQGLIVANGLT